MKPKANFLSGGPGRSVTYQRDQWLSAKVRQLSAFEGQNELSVGVAPFHGRLSRKHTETP
jgi:hypothetical protein